MSILNKIGKDLVLALLNRDNRKSFTFNDIQFSPPIALPVTPDFRNTRTTVSAKPGSVYRGEKVVSYWRLDVARLFVGPNGRLNGEGVTNTLELLDRINARFDMRMTADDVLVENIDTSILPMKYVLKTHPSSFAYIGNVELELVNSLIDLGEVIAMDYMSGVDYPIDPELSEGNLTYLDVNGYLLSAPGVADDTMTKSSNNEIEIYGGFHIQDPNFFVTPLAGVYNIDLADTDEWFLDTGFGLLAGARDVELATLYDIDVDVRHSQGGGVRLTLTKDDEGTYGWSIAGSTNSADLIYQERGGIVADTVSLAWFHEAMNHIASNSVGALLGTFFVTIRAIPKRTIIVKPVTISLIVNVNSI